MVIRHKTYNNVLKVIKLIQAKGYDFDTASKLALRCFDNYEANPNGLSIQGYINLIINAE